MRQSFKLYVANCTQQNQDFVYRVPDAVNSVRRQPIPIGGQILISGDLDEAAVNYIVSQHARYGLVRVDEIDRTKPFIGMCYDVDRPIPAKRIMIALEHNQDVLVGLGKKIREESAVALNNLVENNLQNSGLPGNVTNVEISAVEQETARNPSPSFAEGVRVRRDAPPPSRGARQRSGRPGAVQ